MKNLLKRWEEITRKLDAIDITDFTNWGRPIIRLSRVPSHHGDRELIDTYLENRNDHSLR